MKLALIVNSVVCVLGLLGGVMFAGASIISIANMTVPWRGALLIGAFLVPLAFLVAGIGAWFAGSRSLTIGLMALPWAYGLVFVGCMLVSFKN